MGFNVKVDGNWRSFRHRNYRILFPASTISNIGSWAQRVAQDWLVLELTQSGIYLGIVTAIQFTPFLFFSLHGGAFADRFDKRKLLIGTNALGAFSALTLGTLVMINQVELWHVFALAAVLGISTAIDAPVRQTFAADIVGQDDLPNAVSLNSANFNAGRLVGPALSGLLIAAFGTGPSFLVNGISYLFAIAALMAMNEKEFFYQERAKSKTNVREGLHYALARPDIYVVMMIVFFLGTFGLNFQIFNALMATKEFGKGPAAYGLLGTFVAIGSFSGAIASARLERFRKTRFVILAGGAFALAILVLSILPNYTAYAIFLPICGVTALITMITANSIVQVNSDPAIRGRVMGIYLLIFMGGTPVGSPVIGLMAEAIGIRSTIAACGAICLIATTLIWFKFKDRVDVPADISVAAVLKSAQRD
jgi:MFS family permease